eukprot:TRINITY_DN1400_c4_g1_i1.p1 TRINITY_DN1400_c4_g1~~TRINITY_DN1400_c4_g1_i1.p1  ORF type:complete len:302 (-),score=64.17 TRINITY_DN1400_c4_g1_i1:199-1104(-)
MDINEFNQNYMILKELSLSKKSEVFEVLNLNRNRREVVKILKNKNAKRLEFEASIATSLDHENILNPISVHDFLTDSGKTCKIMFFKLYEMDVFEYCFKKKKPSRNTRVDIFRQMTRAVKYLHDNNMAHGDIKPENFLISRIVKKKAEEEGEEEQQQDIVLSKTENDKEENKGTINEEDEKVKVYMIDFEHLIIQEEKTNKYIPPTEIYRPPETRLSYQKIDVKAADIYSLGISLHAILTYTLPYPENDENNNNSNNNSNNDIFLNPDLSELESTVILSMLDHNPDLRPTIDEVILLMDSF